MINISLKFSVLCSLIVQASNAEVCCVCVQQKTHAKGGVEKNSKEVGGVAVMLIAKNTTSVVLISRYSVLKKVNLVKLSNKFSMIVFVCVFFCMLTDFLSQFWMFYHHVCFPD